MGRAAGAAIYVQNQAVRYHRHSAPTGGHHQRAGPLAGPVAGLAPPACAATGQGGAERAGPAAPPFNVRIQAVRYHDYAPLAVAIHQRAGHWWLKARQHDSHVRVDYYASENGRWRLTGRIAAARLDQRLAGAFAIQGRGQWRAADGDTPQRFKGQLDVRVQQLGAPRLQARANLSLALSWQGSDWQVHAALERPLTLAPDWILLPGEGLQAHGHGMELEQAAGQLAIRGTYAHAVLSWHSADARLAQGSGRLVLSDGVAGKVRFHWAEGRLRIQPFSLDTAFGPTLALTQPSAL